MKKILVIWCLFILTCVPVLADYKPIPSNLSKQYKQEIEQIIDEEYIKQVEKLRPASNLYTYFMNDEYLSYDLKSYNYKNSNSNAIEFEILTQIRDFDNYEPIPKNLQDEYVKRIPENLVENFQLDMSNGLRHILYDKITYNHKTLKQMLLDFNKKSDAIYQEYLNNPKINEQNKVFIEQLKCMQGTISLYPDTIIEQLQPYIEKYNLGLEPGAEADTFLYKYYVEMYHVKYSNELKELLKLKEYVYTKIDIYILKMDFLNSPQVRIFT